MKRVVIIVLLLLFVIAVFLSANAKAENLDFSCPKIFEKGDSLLLIRFYDHTITLYDYNKQQINKFGVCCPAIGTAYRDYLEKSPIIGKVSFVGWKPSWSPSESLRKEMNIPMTAFVVKNGYRYVPYGSPYNPLGDVAIYSFFDASAYPFMYSNLKTVSPYLVHGTLNKGSVGYDRSHGCIRVFNPEAVTLAKSVDLFKKAGTNIVIVYVFSSEQEKIVWDSFCAKDY